MHREMGQPSLVESLLPEKPGQNQRLERVHQAVDWVRIGKLAAQVMTLRREGPAIRWTYRGATSGQLKPALAAQHRLGKRRRRPNPVQAVSRVEARGVA